MVVVTSLLVLLAAALTYQELGLLKETDFALIQRSWRSRAGQLDLSPTGYNNGHAQLRGDLFSRLQQALEAPSMPPYRAYALQRECRSNCSNLGNCMTDLGVCQCPGGERQHE